MIRSSQSWRFVFVLTAVCGTAATVVACCAVAPPGKPVLNADQTVLILWDAAAKTQHFIRQASFLSQSPELGFLVPTPTMPELAESGTEAFEYLSQLTAPAVVNRPRPAHFSCGCGAPPLSKGAAADPVRVLAEKLVAGYDTRVLEADSAEALTTWLQENGFEFSPAVQAWAEPYVSAGWKITALKVAKPQSDEEQPRVAASSLRISFQTDRPLFPYREPDPAGFAEPLQARERLLRIFFIADGNHRGQLTPNQPWTGQVVWSDRLMAENRTKLLELLRLPDTTGPAEWWLTEFEDHWAYQVAPADVYFAATKDRRPVHREPEIRYVSSPAPHDGAVYAIALLFVVWPISRVAIRRAFGHKLDNALSNRR